MKRLLLALALIAAPLAARAATCSGYPITLTNGQLADANQVMANFNSILNCVNTNVLSTTAAAATYAPIVSPSFTGTPTAPAAAPGTNTTQIATTSYVVSALSPYLTTSAAASTYAPLASPALTGTPTAPTAAPLTNNGQLATTGYVDAAVTAGAPPTATTSVQGVTTLATGAQVLAGSDTTHAATPASLAAYQSLGAGGSKGHMIFPGGLQFAWGLSGTIGSGGGSATQTLDNACSSGVYGINITPVGAGGSGGQSYAFVTVLGLGSFSITNNASANLAFYWLVVCK